MCNWQPIVVLVTGRVPLWTALTETSKSVPERTRPVSAQISPDIVTQSVQESAEKVSSSLRICSLLDLMRYRVMILLLVGVACSVRLCVLRVGRLNDRMTDRQVLTQGPSLRMFEG
jgi:hypothetical protein